MDGDFNLDGKKVTLSNNESYNGNTYHLHGGTRGFSHRKWESVIMDSPPGQQTVSFKLHSIDQEEGYPGSLKVETSHSLTVDD